MKDITMSIPAFKIFSQLMAVIGDDHDSEVVLEALDRCIVAIIALKELELADESN